MALIFRSLLMAAFIVALPILVLASDPVDLTDKEGIVDPNDLKKHDPPESSLKINEPPSPKIKEDKQDSANTSPPTDQGNDPGRGASAIPKQVPKLVPPRPLPRHIR